MKVKDPPQSHNNDLKKESTILIKYLPTLNVFISSRWKDKYDNRELQDIINDIEEKLKDRLDKFGVGRAVKVDMSGDYNAKPATEKCIEKVKKADIVIIIYNGHPGYKGICYDEFKAAINSGEARTYLIDISDKKDLEKWKAKVTDTEKFNNEFNERWNHKIKSQKDTPSGSEKLIEKVIQLIIYGIFKLAHDYKSWSKANSGDQLDLVKLGYCDRDQKLKEIFREELKRFKSKQGNPEIFNVYNGRKDFLFSVKYSIQKDQKRFLVFSLYSIPATFSVEQARGINCRPYLDESNVIKKYGLKIKNEENSYLPIPIIICLRNITKAQIRKYYGSENILLVETAFGVYMLDEEKKIQLFFLKNCNNQESIKYRLEQFLRWLRLDSNWIAFNFDVHAKNRYKIASKH